MHGQNNVEVLHSLIPNLTHNENNALKMVNLPLGNTRNHRCVAVSLCSSLLN
jgi:hypothetical protein